MLRPHKKAKQPKPESPSPVNCYRQRTALRAPWNNRKCIRDSNLLPVSPKQTPFLRPENPPKNVYYNFKKKKKKWKKSREKNKQRRGQEAQS